MTDQPDKGEDAAFLAWWATCLLNDPVWDDMELAACEGFAAGRAAERAEVVAMAKALCEDGIDPNYDVGYYSGYRVERENARLRSAVEAETAGAALVRGVSEVAIAALEADLAQAREALTLAQKYGSFDPLSDQTIIRAIAAALNREANDG